MFDRILVLGAGHIGQAIVSLLHQAGDRVTVADVDGDRAARLAARAMTLAGIGVGKAGTPRSDALALADAQRTVAGHPIESVRVDASDPLALAAAFSGVDAVVNALPYRYAAPVARVAVAKRVHYFDLTEDVASTEAIRQLDSQARSVLMPQCGLAPGLIGIIGHHLLRSFDQPRSLKLRVGALPRFPVNALRYNLTWSTEGLINEYCNPCEAIVDGKLCTTAALEGLEHLLIDGIEYEAFNTSGGLGTLAQTLAHPLDGRAPLRRLDYKSLRYPGHRAIMQTLLTDLALGDRRDLLKQILEHAIPQTRQDVVVMLACATGQIDGVLSERSWSRHLHGGTYAGLPMTAIQLTTAVGICAALQCVREGALPARGFVSQEQVDADRLLGNRFGRLLDTGLPAQAQTATTASSNLAAITPAAGIASALSAEDAMV